MKNFGKKTKKLIALLMVVVTIVTMIPMSAIPTLANTRSILTNSGQIQIFNNESYGLKTNDIFYRGNNTIYEYNKKFAANPGWPVSNPTWTNVDQKYLTEHRNGGAHKHPVSQDVPLYRLTRSGGYTVGDYNLEGVTPIDVNDIGAFVAAAKEDATNNRATINKQSAQMIRKVLVNGFKQDRAHNTGYEYNKELLYFLATQCIIWEIQEKKRIGWGNDTHYRGTQTSKYPENASAFGKQRSNEIKKSYNSKLPDSSKYYWHDYYYTVYYNQFQWDKFPDYYDQILKACAVMDSKLEYGIDNGTGDDSTPWRLPTYEPTDADTWSLFYNKDTKMYERSFYVSPELLGDGYNMYNPKHIVLPLKEGVNNITLKGSVPLRAYCSFEAETLRNVSGSPKVLGVTADGNWYLVTVWGKTGYVYWKDVDDWHKYQSDMTVKSDGRNGYHLTFSTPRVGNFNYTIRWDKFALTGFNDPNYFSGSGGTVGEQKNTSRGYLSGGNAAQKTVYLGLKTAAKTVSFYCSLHKDLLGRPKNELMTSITAPVGDSIIVPNYHDHTNEQYNFKYWAGAQGPTAIESGQEYPINDLESVYTAMYSKQFEHSYVCDLCGAVIKTFEGPAGTQYNVPQHQHTHSGEYKDAKTEFKYYTERKLFSPEKPTIGSLKTINENKTYFAQYDILNDLDITAFGLDEKDSKNWKSKPDTSYKNSSQKDNYENGNYISATHSYKDMIVQGTNVFITPPKGYHIEKIVITDKNGTSTKHIIDNTTNGGYAYFQPDLIKSTNIDVYFEKNNVQKTITVNHVIAENECDFKNPDNIIVETRQTELTYGTKLNFEKDNMIIDGKETPYFYPKINYDNQEYSYCGEYGYGYNDIENSYIHDANDKMHHFKDLTDYDVCTDMNIYVYYKEGAQGGININVFAEGNEKNILGKTTKDAIDFEANSTKLNIYYSDEQLDLNDLYQTNENGEKILNSKLVHFKDISPYLKPVENTVSGYDAQDYPYVSSYNIKPEDLIADKYYYFVIDDNIDDNFYFDPLNTGGKSWNGFEQEYNFVCSPGPYKQSLQVLTVDDNGDKYPAQNANIIYMDYDLYSNLSFYNVFFVAKLQQSFENGQITKSEYENKLALTQYIPWDCPECGSMFQRGTECAKCHYLNEGVSSAVHYVKTDENGMAYFSTDCPGFAFNIMNDNFISNNKKDNTMNYSNREVAVTTPDNNGLMSQDVITSKNIGGLLSDFWIDMSTNDLVSLGSSVFDTTVCTLSSNKEPYTFNIYSNEDLTGVDYKMIVKYKQNVKDTYEVLEEKIYSKTAQITDTYNQVEYVTGPFSSKQGDFTNKVVLEYQPPKVGYYDIEIQLLNNTKSIYFACNYISDVIYNGSSKDFNLAIFPGNIVSQESQVDITFDKFTNSIMASKYDIPIKDASFINNFAISLDIYSKRQNNELATTIAVPQSIINKANEKLKNNVESFIVSEEFYDDNIGKKYSISIQKDQNNRFSLNNPDGRLGKTKELCQSNFKISIKLFDLQKNNYTAKLNYNTDSIYNTADNQISEQSENFKDVKNFTTKINLSNENNGFRLQSFDKMETTIYKEIIDGDTLESIKTRYQDRIEKTTQEPFVNQKIYDNLLSGMCSPTYLKNNGYKYYTIEYYPSGNLNGIYKDSIYESDLGYMDLTYQEVVKQYSKKYGSVHDSTGSLDGQYHSIDDLNTATLRHTAGIYKSDLGKYDFDAHLYIKLYKELPEQDTPNYNVDFIEPNAGYKFGTTVVSSFMVNNLNNVAFKDTNPLSTKFDSYVKFKVNNGMEQRMPVFTANKDLVLPGKLNNILYYRWTIPAEDNLKQTISAATGTDVNKIKITGFDVTSTVTDKNTNYSKSDTGTVNVARITDSTVAKSGYDLDGGKNFKYIAPTNNKSYHNVAQWQEYICVNGEFKLLDNTAKLKFTSIFLRPDEMTPTKAVAQNSMGEYQWLTRSGYAVRTEVQTKSLVNSTDETIINSSCTPAQTSEVYYPEFNYVDANSKKEPLILDKTANIFKFKDVENAGDIRSRHYIPVWYPDGDYITQVYVSDMWTPAGMLDYAGESNPVGIKGSLFDDYRTQHKDF